MLTNSKSFWEEGYKKDPWACTYLALNRAGRELYATYFAEELHHSEYRRFANGEEVIAVEGIRSASHKALIRIAMLKNRKDFYKND